jgi:DNA polymerase I
MRRNEQPRVLVADVFGRLGRFFPSPSNNGANHANGNGISDSRTPRTTNFNSRVKQNTLPTEENTIKNQECSKELENPVRPVREEGKAPEYRLVTTREELAAVAEDLGKAKGIYLDVETYGQNALDPRHGDIRILTMTRENGVPWILDLKAMGYDLGPVADVLHRLPCVAHNARFDFGFLRAKCGFKPQAAVVCTLMLSRLLNAGTNNGNDLGTALKDNLGVEIPKGMGKSDWGGMILTDEQLAYAAEDVTHLPKLLAALMREIREAGLLDVANMETRLFPVIVGMTARGFAVDVDKLAGIRDRARNEASEAAKLMQARLGPINMASPKQLLKALQGAGHAIESTDNEALQNMADKELAGGIIAYRDAEKLAQQAQSLLEATTDGRIHADYDPTGTATGRFSCRRPNLQNVARGELRDCFIAPPGRALVVCDYSQIELRLAACLANDTKMLEAFREGIDLHAATASIVLDKPMDQVSKEDRQLAKAVNFGLIYGQSAGGLVRYAKTSYGVELGERRAQAIRERFFKAYTGLERWHRISMSNARGGAVMEARTLTNRRRLLPEGDAWPRFTGLVNTPVQGTAADAIKQALILLNKRLPDGAHVIATIHDEIVCECTEADAEAVLATTRKAMLDALGNIAKNCPGEVEGGLGKSWGAAK